MYSLAYAETQADAPGEARARERDAIARSIELLEAAQSAGASSREAVVALDFLRRLWSILIEDLAAPGNELPPELRAQIISIGIWLMRQAEEIRLEHSRDFSGLLQISRTILEGLA